MTQRYQVDNDPLDEESALESPQTEVFPKYLKCPVYNRDDSYPLIVSHHDDIVFINQHPAVLGNGDAGPAMADGQRLIPLDIDGDEHTRFRRILDPLFAPKAKTSQIANLEPVVRRLANSLIDEFIDRGEVELYQAFCVPLPTIIFVDLLGLPQEDRPFFLQFKDDVIHPAGDTPEANNELRINAAVRMMGYLNEQLDVRQDAPEKYPGLLSALQSAEGDNGQLERLELLNIFFLLMIAGLDTVTGALSCMFARLARHPEEQRRVRDTANMATAVEELLRYESPVQWGHRLATEDITLPSGYQVKAGDYLQLLWAAANLDESNHPDPMEVKFDRTPNRHIAFASGIHRCLGSHLARLELRCALEEFHRRVADYRITPGESPVYPGGTVRSVAPLPLTFEARPV
ncbi:MAG: cytochrome P450 [Mycobacterium sp.]